MLRVSVRPASSQSLEAGADLRGTVRDASANFCTTRLSSHSALEVDRTGVSAVIERQQIDGLPINGRN